MTEPTDVPDPGGPGGPDPEPDGPEATPEVPEAAPAAAEDGPDLDLNVNAGDPLPDDDVDDGLDD